MLKRTSKKKNDGTKIACVMNMKTESSSLNSSDSSNLGGAKKNEKENLLKLLSDGSKNKKTEIKAKDIIEADLKEDTLDLSYMAKKRLLADQDSSTEALSGEQLKIKLNTEALKHYLRTGEQVRF